MRKHLITGLLVWMLTVTLWVAAVGARPDGRRSSWVLTVTGGAAEATPRVG
jgi:hypothetical protein